MDPGGPCPYFCGKKLVDYLANHRSHSVNYVKNILRSNLTEFFTKTLLLVKYEY